MQPLEYHESANAQLSVQVGKTFRDFNDFWYMYNIYTYIINV